MQIQEKTSADKWSYVPSEQNPADVASRGIHPSNLIQCQLWWHGPQFILSPPEQKPKFRADLTIDETQIVRSEYNPASVLKITICVKQCLQIKGTPLIELYDSLAKVRRVTALVHIACAKLLKHFSRAAIKNSVKKNLTIGQLTIKSQVKATDYWVKYEQSKYLKHDLADLSSDPQILSDSSSLIKLNPFLDTNGILRVGGRMENANITYDEKHPIIVPNHSTLSKLLLKEAHVETLHGSVQQMLHYVRARYWIMGGRRAAVSITKQCLECIRHRAEPTVQLMGNLPKERVTPSRPFFNCGVDFFGPFKVKRYSGRCKQIDTGYAAVFICMVTRMIHIECVSDLITERFLWALQRMSSIYGMPSKMFSDNGTTFKGAETELKNILKSWQTQTMQDFLNVRGTTWRFITPRAPFQGGIWEAAVKSTKYHMKRILQEQIMTFEEYQTLFSKIAAVLNSRPIVPLNDDPTDLNYLTPSHAVIGERIVQPFACRLTDVPINRVTRMKLLDRLQQDFWNSFRKDYLSTLQTRYRWNKKEQNLKIDDIVLIKEDNLPPGLWLIARVIEVFPGADGLVRNVKLLTIKQKELSRPVQKLVRLPIRDEDQPPREKSSTSLT